MPKVKVFFRTDANSTVGMGHLVRCTALAEMLANDFDIIFLVSNTPASVIATNIPPGFKVFETGPDEMMFIKKAVGAKDILVLDGYNFDTEYQAEVKAMGMKLVYIDDLHSFTYSADVIINQAEFIKETDYKVNGKAQFCLGPKYALLRQPFLNAAKETRKAKTISSVFVSFGGADNFNVTEKMIKTLLSSQELKAIHVLTGPVNENVAKWREQYAGNTLVNFYSTLNSHEVCALMKKCELALVPSSSLSLEVCAVGMVLLTGVTAENQSGYYDALTRNSAALGIGNWIRLTEEELRNKIEAILIYDSRDFDWFVKNQRAYIDGLSGERFLKIFHELAA